jgi:hypothetical protein
MEWITVRPDFGNICHEESKRSKFKIEQFNNEDEEIAQIFREVISHKTRRGNHCNCLTKHATRNISVGSIRTAGTMISLVNLILYTRNYVRSMRQLPDDVLKCTLKGNIIFINIFSNLFLAN